jgi:hypothetical protein
MQGLRGRLHLRAQPSEVHVQGLRGRLHLRAQPSEGAMQGLRGRLHLRAHARALNRDMSVSRTSWHKGVILGRNSVFGVFRL